VLHIHRFDHGEALARFDAFALSDGERDQASLIGARMAVALPSLALGSGEWIGQRHERLSLARERECAARGLVERDLTPDTLLQCQRRTGLRPLLDGATLSVPAYTSLPPARAAGLWRVDGGLRSITDR
jgi:hypothetical protein